MLVCALSSLACSDPATTAPERGSDTADAAAPPDDGPLPVAEPAATVPVPPPGGLASTPLAPRRPPDGATLFDRLLPERTGIAVRNAWEAGAGASRELNNAVSGGGVAVGDADGDGLPDVLITRFLGTTRLYRNLGDLRFEDVTEAAGLGADASGGGATFVDVDGDGDQDLSIVSHGAANRLYENLGDGTFRERAAQAGLDFLGASITVAFGDVDLDGDLDAFLLTNRFSQPGEVQPAMPLADGRPYVPDELSELYDLVIDPLGRPKVIQAGQRDHLYRNDGSGTFTEVTDQAGIAGNHYGLSAVFWDPDGDLWPDLSVSNDFWGPDRLYRNRRDGGFDEVAGQAYSRTPWFSMGSDAGDVDNDGRLDLFASDMSPTSRRTRLVNRGDVWASRWFLQQGRPRQTVRNALHVNTGTERFLEVAELAGLSHSDWTWSTCFGDLDADGRLDLFVSNGMTRSYFDSDLRREAESYRGAEQDAFWAGTPPLLDRNLAFRNLGDLEFESVGDAWGLDQAAASFGATLADLDGDGDLDVLANNFEDVPFLLRNGSVDGHVLVVRLVGAASPRDGVGAWVTITTPADDPTRSLTGLQTRYVSLTHGYLGGVEPRAHFGLGAHDRVETLTVRWPSGHVQRFDDLPADHLHVIAEPAGEPPPRVEPERPAPLFVMEQGPVASEARYDDFKHQPMLPWRLSTMGPGLACGDVDGDGDVDAWLGGPAGQPGTVLLQQAEGAFEPATQPVLELDDFYEDMGGLLLELDGDGDLDLFVASGGVEARPGSMALRDRLYLGADDGSGVFARADKAALPDLRESHGPVAAADVDGDGDLDLVVGGSTLQGAWPRAPASRLLRNTGGVFDDVTAERAPALLDLGMVTGATFADVDDDGRPDLVVTSHWDPVRVLPGTADGLGAPRSLSGPGLWNGVVAGDVDGDGDLDLVATNLGLNTPHHASADAPYVVHAGDLDGSGDAGGLVEAIRADGREVPVRCLDCVRHGLPFVAAAFETHAAYADSALVDIYGQDVLAGCARYEVTELRSAVLRNDGRGGFAFEPLPRRAQVAPSFGAALVHADDDGLPDLVLAQNASIGHAEAGFWDGGLGLLLRGDGAGGFAPLAADASGVVIPDDGRAVVEVPLAAGGSATLVACSDAPLRILRPARGDEPPSVTVRLLGGPGNPTAVGARITLVRRDGHPLVHEVTAGGGYLAQSAGVWVTGVAPRDVAAVQVRWPDGATSEHAQGPDADTGRVVISRP